MKRPIILLIAAMCVALFVGAVSPARADDPVKVRPGDRSPAARQLQKDLMELGYSVGPAKADGKFGPHSVAALKRFQKDQGLTVDGVYGPATQKALDDALAAKRGGKYCPPCPTSYPEIAKALQR